MYKYSDRKKKISASRFGLAGRHAFPILSHKKASKEINKITLLFTRSLEVLHRKFAEGI